MSEFAASSAEPSYIARLALQSAPFSAVVDAQHFFNGAQIEQRLNLLLHLIRATNKLGFIIAPQGVGKSCLLTQLQQKAGDNIRVCRIDCKPSLDLQTILLQCLYDFGVDNHEVQLSSEHTALLNNRLKQLQKINIRPLLLLDDIHKLQSPALAEITNWLLWQQDEQYLLHAVITTSDENFALKPLQTRLQKIDLPKLSEQELKPYLMHRLSSVGYQGELPFTDKDIKQFYRQSEGLPALVNQLAHQRLLGLSPKLNNPFNSHFPNLSGVFKWFGVGILVFSLMLLLLFQQQINDLFTQNNETVDEFEQILLPEDELASVVVIDDPITSLEQAERDKLVSLVAEIEKPQISLEQQQSVNPQEDKSSVELQSEMTNKPSPVNNSAAIHQQDWIMQQHATNYTFQLMGSWDRSEVAAFIDKYALTGDVAEFESMRNGKVWYALIYGVYDNKQAALKASSSWPAPLNTLPSWLRRFDSVQKQIRSKTEAQ